MKSCTLRVITVTRATTANVHTHYVITHTYSNKGLLMSACMHKIMVIALPLTSITVQLTVYPLINNNHLYHVA